MMAQSGVGLVDVNFQYEQRIEKYFYGGLVYSKIID